MTSQLQVLNKILQTKDFSLIELNNLTEDFFFNYKAEFNYIKNHYEKYGTIPDKLTFLGVFPDWDIIEVDEPDSYLIEQLYKDYNSSFIATRFNKIRELVEAGKVDEATNYLVKSVENLHQGSAIQSHDLFQDTSRYDRYLERVANHDKYYISTGFKELDAIIGGLDCENENMVIAARTGIGKTWTLLIMAAAAAMAGKRVGIYSGEMTVDKVGYRLDTIIGGINNNIITRGIDTSVQMQYKQYLESLKACNGTIKVLTPNDIAGPATVAALRAFVEKEHLDVLFIDQYSLLEDTSHAQSGHERVANISKAVKNLQVMKRIPIVSVAQMNRTKNEDGEKDTTQIGLSDRIGQDATCIIMLDRERVYEDKEKTKIKDDRLIMDITKSRDGGTGKLIYHANFNTGKFVLVNPDVKTDPNRYEVDDSDSNYSGNGEVQF
jgi:replicative DNA helicase